ncbi:hypothetical protein SUGI_0267930 [Cryptomeria japonica]|uniref:probable xyloglucan endotransglucosylase/hydrolase protein 10 n=1 Tax=Cryptomeria japonica TaxID=3369 RepID=UPI002408E85E|nr:probable xyloglucan endotransglucosylase/hydrolase protein 10 [Cryptomeria japonica]GLJ16087.1 hypothetical protein SUGI_0267930 [Cryptomeria japonica]
MAMSKGGLSFVLALLGLIWGSAGLRTSGVFDDDFYVTWAPDHVRRLNGGRTVQISLDRRSGAGFASKQAYLFGKFEVRIKLPPGNSAGTVVAYYLYSNQPNRDEIDIEFLGNVVGKKYIMQTNIFSDGYGNREQRIGLWFDPTAQFHTYTVFWNRYHILFFVDGVLIRAHKNNAVLGIAYPRRQPMSLYASIWNGEDWATNGGKTKITWRNNDPFVAGFTELYIDGCVWNGNPRFCKGGSTNNWWNERKYAFLSSRDSAMLRWTRSHFLIYDYCNDKTRGIPTECFHKI